MPRKLSQIWTLAFLRSSTCKQIAQSKSSSRCFSRWLTQRLVALKNSRMRFSMNKKILRKKRQTWSHQWQECRWGVQMDKHPWPSKRWPTCVWQPNFSKAMCSGLSERIQFINSAKAVVEVLAQIAASSIFLIRRGLCSRLRTKEICLLLRTLWYQTREVSSRKLNSETCLCHKKVTKISTSDRKS